MINKTNDNQTSTQSDIINWLRFPLIIMVVYSHSCGNSDSNLMVLQAGLYEIVRVVWGVMIAPTAVPAFFFISGFLMFYRLNEYNRAIYVSKMKKRLNRLLVPFLIWNIIALVIWLLREINAGASFGDTLSSYYERGLLSCLWVFYTIGDENVDILGNTSHLTAPADLPLWFLRDLIVVTIISPIFYYSIKKLKYFSTLLFSLYYVSGVYYNIPGLSSVAISFYGLGAFFSIIKLDFSIITNRYLKITLPLYIFLLLFILYIFNSKLAFQLFPLLRLMGVFAIIGTAEWMIRCSTFRIPQALSDSTFFIYAIHYIMFLSFVDKLLGLLLPASNEIAHTLLFILSPLVKVFIYSVIYILLCSLTPKTMAFLCGNKHSSLQDKKSQ